MTNKPTYLRQLFLSTLVLQRYLEEFWIERRHEELRVLIHLKMRETSQLIYTIVALFSRVLRLYLNISD